MAPLNGDMAARCLAFLLFFMCVSCCFSAVLTYSREELLLLRTGKEILDTDARRQVDLLGTWIGDSGQDVRSSQRHRSRRRGSRGGKLVKLRKYPNRPPLPSIYLANVRSLRNKTDELNGLIYARKDFRDCCVYFFTETWLDSSIPDTVMTPPGFTLFRSDRILSDVDKERGTIIGVWSIGCSHGPIRLNYKRSPSNADHITCPANSRH